VKNTTLILLVIKRLEGILEEAKIAHFPSSSPIQVSTFKTEALTAQKDALNGADTSMLENVILCIYSVKPDSVIKITDWREITAEQKGILYHWDRLAASIPLLMKSIFHYYWNKIAKSCILSYEVIRDTGDMHRSKNSVGKTGTGA
jgi:hypothetical protein